MNIELKIAINTSFGGFHLNEEMAMWLANNRGWKIINERTYIKDAPIETLQKVSTDMYFHPSNNDSIEFRSNKSLIECIETLQKLHENDKFSDKSYSKIFQLNVRTYKIFCEIENYYDGKERVNVYTSEI